MARRLLTVSAVAVAFAAFFNSSPPPVVDQTPTRGLGLIEHRGQFYRFEDLMNPDFRAASKDPFVQSFNQQPHFADPWAGLGDPKETLSEFELRRSEIWHNDRITIEMDDDPRLREVLSAPLPWAGGYMEGPDN